MGLTEPMGPTEPMEPIGAVTDFDGLRFVIARYSEDIGWVPSLLEKFPGSRCTVYNKGPTPVPESTSYEVLPLDNVGRESHTYLHHVVQSYSSAEHLRDEIIVFLQGHPFDHCRGTSLSRSVSEGVNKIMKGSMFENIGSQVIQIVDGEPRFHMSIMGELASTWFDLGLGRELPKRFEFSAGALFVTSRDSISNRHIGFYQKALGMLSMDVNPTRGFCFERLWSLIFGKIFGN